MLYLTAVEPKLLEITRQLQQLPIFSELRLVGGTALALQLGHRKSTDIDLFGKFNTDIAQVKEAISEIPGSVLLNYSRTMFFFNIGLIKVDIVNYNYPWIDELVYEDNLRLAGVKDIAAMKFAAITNRGKKKDFYDLYFLLQHFTFDELMKFYETKFQDASSFLTLKSMLYFDDAELDETPVLFTEISWDKIKAEISQTIKNYVNTSAF